MNNQSDPTNIYQGHFILKKWLDDFCCTRSLSVGESAEKASWNINARIRHRFPFQADAFRGHGFIYSDKQEVLAQSLQQDFPSKDCDPNEQRTYRS